MSNQTESYIVLKPIAERFSRIAGEITDEEIKNIIKSAMREQVSQIDFASTIQIVVDEWFEDESHIDFICKSLNECIKDKFKRN